MELPIMALLGLVAWWLWVNLRRLYVLTDEDCTPERKARRDRQRHRALEVLMIFWPLPQKPKQWKIEERERLDRAHRRAQTIGNYRPMPVRDNPEG